MKKRLRSLLICLALCLAVGICTLVMPGADVAMAQAEGVDGLVTVESINNVDDTVNYLVGVLEERGLLVARVIDHAANAESVGLELRPTKVILFGNPALGTQLMNNNIRVGIDLPQKFLVWEDENGTTHLSYNDPQYLVKRHALTGPQEVIDAITGALQNFANMVALPAPEVLPVTGATRYNSAGWFVLIFLFMGLILIGRGLLRQRVFRIGALVLLVGMSYAFLLAEKPLNAQERNGLIQADSPYSVDETVARLQEGISARNLKTMMVLDHAANAETVGQSLLPTKLIFFGNPQVGTQLMQSNRSIAIDLPQKFLVWEDAEGQVHVAYNEPSYLAARHGITDKDELLGKVTATLAEIVATATTE